MKWILLVENNHDLREAVVHLLMRAGYAVASSPDGASALRLLDEQQTSPPSLILFDLQMPEVDGWTFRAAQLENPCISQVPAIAMTGMAKIEPPIDAHVVLRKPFAVADLMAAVRALVVLGGTPDAAELARLHACAERCAQHGAELK